MATLFHLESIMTGNKPTVSQLLKDPLLCHAMPTLSPDEVKDKLRCLGQITIGDKQVFGWYHVLSAATSDEDVFKLKGTRVCRPFFNQYLVGEIMPVIYSGRV